MHTFVCVHFGLIMCRVPDICLLKDDEHVYVDSYSQFACVLVILSFVFSYNDLYVNIFYDRNRM